jgi:hypothetical protein
MPSTWEKPQKWKQHTQHGKNFMASASHKYNSKWNKKSFDGLRKLVMEPWTNFELKHL